MLLEILANLFTKISPIPGIKGLDLEIGIKRWPFILLGRRQTVQAGIQKTGLSRLKKKALTQFASFLLVTPPQELERGHFG